MSLNPDRRKALKLLAMVVVTAPVLSILPTHAAARKAKFYTDKSSDKALEGHDPVSYFSNAGPVKGLEKFSIEYEDVRWLFSSEQNMQAFSENPEQYTPQFGGYCSFSVAKGKLVKGDASLWKIVDGKLYVNFNKGIHKLWLTRANSLIAKGQKNWPTILG